MSWWAWYLIGIATLPAAWLSWSVPRYYWYDWHHHWWDVETAWGTKRVPHMVPYRLARWWALRQPDPFVGGEQ